MYFIIVGCGAVGATLGNVLAAEGHDVVVVDRESKAFAKLGSGFNGVTIAGTGIDEDILKRAGVERADGLAAVTSNDATNIMLAQMAKNLFHVPRVVARVYDQDKESVYKEFGLDTVSPTVIGVDHIRGMLLSNGLGCRYAMGEVEILQIPVNGFLSGRTLAEVASAYGLRCIAVTRARRTTMVPDDTALAPGDFLWAAADSESVSMLRRALHELRVGDQR